MQVTAAYRILRGEDPHTVLTSKWGFKKQLSFYHCILEPSNTEWITIDGHASSAADGWRAPIGANDFHIEYESAVVKPAQYRVLELVYREAAREVGLSPLQFQAVVWLVWRRLEVGTDVKHLEAAA